MHGQAKQPLYSLVPKINICKLKLGAKTVKKRTSEKAKMQIFFKQASCSVGDLDALNRLFTAYLTQFEQGSTEQSSGLSP